MRARFPVVALISLLLGAGLFAACDLDGGGPDPCLGQSCSGQGVCVSLNRVPYCRCNTGYHAVQMQCLANVVSCEGVTCSYHGACSLERGWAECLCDPGFRPLGLDCVDDGLDPCAGETCSGHGACVEYEAQAYCECDPGYAPDGLRCLEIAGPCDGVDCSGHGACLLDIEGYPYCDCELGYEPFGLSCINSSDPCDGIDCSNHGYCQDMEGYPWCTCDSGWLSTGADCVPDTPDPCQEVSCSDHGQCLLGPYDAPFCDCDPGYEPDGLNCIPSGPTWPPSLGSILNTDGPVCLMPDCQVYGVPGVNLVGSWTLWTYTTDSSCPELAELFPPAGIDNSFEQTDLQIVSYQDNCCGYGPTEMQEVTVIDSVMALCRSRVYQDFLNVWEAAVITFEDSNNGWGSAWLHIPDPTYPGGCDIWMDAEYYRY